MPSLNALRAFETVGRLLSYRAAAEELNVTPGAVKHLVAKLEATLGAPLVQRKGQGLELTPLGRAGMADMSLGMRHFSDGVRKMRRHRTDARVIVSVEASLATTWLSPRLDQFWTQHPEVDLIVDVSQHIKDLQRSEIDVAIRYGVPTAPGLVAKRLFEDLVFPACSPSLAAGAMLEDLDQLRDVPLIHWDMSQMSWARETHRWFAWESWLRRAGVANIDLSKGKRFSDYSLAVQAAASGQGVMLAGWPAMMDTLDAGLLVCPFPGGVMETDIGFDLVMLEGADQRAEIVVFTDWITHAAANVRSFR